MDKVLLCVYGAVNLAVFIMYGIDKGKAKGGRWRISEKTLVLSAVLGIVGGLMGMVITKRNSVRMTHGVLLYFVSVFKRFVQRYLIGIFQLTAYRQTKGEPCDLNAQRFEQL